MLRMMKMLAGTLLVATLAACGGGGGSPGATTGGNGGTGGGSNPGTTTGTPTIALTLVDGNGASIPGNSVASGAVVEARAIVKDSNGQAVANKLVAFNSSASLVVFQPSSGQVLTDGTGVAKVQVSPATINTSGADTLTASTTVDSQSLSATLDVQTSAANVALANFTAGQSSISAFQSTPVSVDVTVNGVPAASNPVQVSFVPSCGSVSPTTSPSNSSGKAVTTFNATGCSGGTATVTASASGASSVQTSINVQTPTATNLLFVSATPSTIYTSVAAFGVKQSTVVFKVVDASGAAVMSPTNVQVSLSTSAIASGVVFADTNSTTPKVVSTDANGLVSVIVKSGSVPTPLALSAQLVSNPVITAASAGLSVDSGRPSQAFFSLSAEKYNIEGWNHDGEPSRISVLLADRLGQPVPAGTPVSFVTEGGQVSASCSVTIDSNGKSGCSVIFVSQAFRPTNGRVTLLAYAEGEEVFVDANGNNRYDAGETYYDMGQPFLDNDESGTYGVGEQKIGDPSVPGSGIGALSCPAASSGTSFLLPSVPSTCDGTWGSTRVRGQIVLVFSTDFAAAPTFQVKGLTIDFDLADQNGNAMPNGSVISATVNGGTGCSVDQIIPSIVGNATNPTHHSILMKEGSAGGCAGAAITVKVTTPKNNVTLLGSIQL